MDYQLQVPKIGRMNSCSRMPTASTQPSQAVTEDPPKVSPRPVEEVKEDWVLQMEMLEELEEWTRVGNERIPSEIKAELLLLIDSFPGLQRIPIYILLDSYYWDLSSLQQFVSVIQRIEQLLKMDTILFLKSLVPKNLHHVALQLFHTTKSKAIMDFIQSLPQSQGEELIDLAKYQPATEFQQLADILLELGASKVYSMLSEVKLSPTWNKHCNLCRTKRRDQLEFRMIHDQVPGNKMPIAALLEHYHHPDELIAPDCRLYSFDPILGKVYWQRYEVDLVNICDECLRQAHEAVALLRPVEPFHHIDADKRKQVIRDTFNHEEELAQIVGRLAHLRGLRRLKELLLRSLKHWQHGKSEEAKAEQQRAQEAAQRKHKEEKIAARSALLDRALMVDQRWKTLDRQSDLKALRKRMDYALIQKKLTYTEFNPASKQRKHSKSWQLSDVDENGLPLTEAAARRVFGYEVDDAEVDETDKLGEWRSIADRKANYYQARRDAQKAEQRREELRRYEELKDYVRERLIILDRHQKQMIRIAEQAEEDRLAKRAAEKSARRAQRFAKYLEDERQRMVIEDRRSGEMRFLQYETVREAQERARMWEEECEQCERDRFWGLDYFENMMRREELRLRQFYEDRVRYKNDQLRQMGAMNPLQTAKLTVFGTLPEDREIDNNQERRMAIIRKLKAEEVRSTLRRVRLPFIYSKG